MQNQVEHMPGWSGLRARFAGEVVLPSSSAYDVSRVAWNRDIDRRPLALFYCSGVDDVVAAVHFAREADVLTAVRSGGHSYPGHSSVDDGVVIDLSRMSLVTVDPEKRIVSAGGGVLLRDVDRATAAHGLVMPAGVVSHTGLAGLGLGGGMGYLSRSYGLTCDQFLRLEVVTADGEVINASADEHPNLFWGLRGGGGNFGIVTRFDCALHPLGLVQGGWMFFPYDRAADVLYNSRMAAADGPSELHTFFVMGVPAEPLGMADVGGRRLLGARILFNGDEDAGNAALKDLRAFGKPLIDGVCTRRYEEFQGDLDSYAAPGDGWYMKAGHTKELTRDLITTIVEQSAVHEGRSAVVQVISLGGAVSDVGEMDTAYAGRAAQWHLGIEVKFNGQAEREHIVAWTRDTWDRMAPNLDMSTSYVNMLVDPGLHRLEEAFGGREKFRRLRQVKTAYDPTNFFRCNSNIPPLNANEC